MALGGNSANSAQGLGVLPTIVDGVRLRGIVIVECPVCTKCTHMACAESAREPGEIGVCGNGVNYANLGDGLVAHGFFAEGWSWPYGTSKTVQRLFKRQRRTLPNLVAALPDVQRWISNMVIAAKQERTARETLTVRRVDQVIDEGALGELVRAKLAESLMQYQGALTHDLTKLVSAAFQNIDSCIEVRYGAGPTGLGEQFPGERTLSPMEQAKVWKRMKAAYYLCQLADLRIELLDVVGAEERGPPNLKFLHVHKMFNKIIKPYQIVAERRGVDLITSGVSYGTTFGDYNGYSIVPLTMIDNAVKYAPSGSQVIVNFQDHANEIIVTTRSLGPRIEASEASRIYTRAYRGKAAQGFADGGGIGLWLARSIVDENGGEIFHEQESHGSRVVDGRSYVRTRFYVQFPIGKKPLPPRS